MNNWISVEDELPTGKVIALYANGFGKPRRIMAEYINRYSVESSMGDGVDDEYSEKDDAYYITEGWYEIIENWDEWRSIKVTDGEVTYWMTLPKPPEDK